MSASTSYPAGPSGQSEDFRHAVPTDRAYEDRPTRQGSCQKNVGDYERIASMIAGATLVAWGLGGMRRGSLLSTLIGGALAYRGATGHCHLYGKLGLNTNKRNDATGVPARRGYRVEQTIVINKSASELYSFWRDVENLPKVMPHLKSVEAIDRVRSHWVAQEVLGRSAEWDAEVFNDKENEIIAWRSLPDSDVDTAGSVRFTALPNGRGSEVAVELKYDAPYGKAGAWIASLLGSDPGRMIEQDLRRFKGFMETGEHVTAEG